MINFQVLETFSAAPLHMVSGISDLELVEQDGRVLLYTATRAGGGVLALDVTGAMALVDQDSLTPGSTLPAEATVETLTINGLQHLIVTGGTSGNVLAFPLGADGSLAGPVQLPGSLAGALTAQCVVEDGGQTFLYAARMGESTILTYAVAADGTLALVGSRVMDGPHTGVDISSLTAVTVGGSRFMISLSLDADVVRVFPVGADGLLGKPTVIGAPGGLGINDPTDVKVVLMGGATYLVVASPGSSSISVLGIDHDGGLRVVDHVVDTLDTRFQGVQALATAEVGDRVFVIAGGGDEGITVMTLTPEGRLITCGQLLQTPGVMLDNITAMTAQVVNGMIELFVTGEGCGITRLVIDPGSLSPIQTGGAVDATVSGTAGEDMILGGDGAEAIQGGEGNDILGDGGGCDTVVGGADSDVFVMDADGAHDVIGDFQLGIDCIDLSAWGAIHSLSALTIIATATGALISWNEETLELITPNGLPIPPGSFELSDFIGLWHAPPIPTATGSMVYGTNQIDDLVGTADGEIFVVSSGPDTIDGGEGYDFIDLGRATGGVRVFLDNMSLNTNIASGQILLSIEGIIGSGFSDTLGGNGADNIIEGREGNDRLSGGAGNDSLYGGIANDHLMGGAGADVLDGGIGRDRTSYRESTTGLVVDMSQPALNTGDASGDSYSSIEELEGSFFNDTLGGDDISNQIFGVDGNDRLEGRGGNDSLFGGEGSDTLLGGVMGDRLDGGNGVDFASYETSVAAIRIDLMNSALATGDAVGDIYNLIEGFILTAFGDSFYGTEGVDRALGEAGNDKLTGRGGADWLSGGAGNDLLFGGAGDDTLLGGAGFDRLEGGTGRDVASYADAAAGVRVDLSYQKLNTGEAKGDILVWIEDLEGSAFADTLAGTSGANSLSGLGGNDLLLGRSGNDTLFGGAGADTLLGGRGADRLFGGEGLDIASYVGSGSLRVDLANLSLATGDARGDFLDGIEGLEGGSGSDTLMGDAQGNVLIGGAGSDQMDGRSGADTLLGGSGNDLLAGGEGDDRLEGGSGNDRLDGGLGDDDLNGDKGNDRLIGGEGNDLVDGGSGNDQLDAGAGDDALYGGSGSDRLDAGAGHDALYGGSGNDLLAGGEGDDRLEGGSGNDRLEGDLGDDDLYGDTGNDRLIGGEGNDRLDGGSGKDQLDGGAGDDVLFGGDGNDSLTGGDGDDRLEGGAGTDRLEGGAGCDHLFGGDLGDDDLYGDTGNDRLIGGEGNDRLDGGSGNDRLTGGAGDDWLVGAAGNDRFVFSAGADVVADFHDHEDKLVLDKALWGGTAPDVADLMLLAQTTDVGLHLDFGNGNTLDILGIFDANLIADDILFM